MSARIPIVCTLVLVLAAATAGATDPGRLAAIEAAARAEHEALRGPAYEALVGKVVGPMQSLLADPDLALIGVLPSGRPLFYATTNLSAAATVSTDAVWPGGWTGLGLTGANTLGSLAIWDGGAVRVSHQEFQGRVVLGDAGSSISSHATHVAATIVAGGMRWEAVGMSPFAQLRTFDWNYDASEMANAAANGLRISNHSYGFVAGWRYGWGSTTDQWFWFGDTDLSEVEDAGFGFYYSTAAVWDDIAHAAPYYLIVKSAGNDRNDAGPAPGGGHYYWQNSSSSWAWSTAVRDPDGGADGYDSIPYHGVAKNLLSVGAVNDIPGGWTAPGDVVMSSFSSFGPTDDGRIKPDLVANGVGLLSAHSITDTSYASFSGTSMSAPNVTGSLNLLVQQYQSLNGGQPLLASALKAIVLHTASEAGPAPGPDYGHGWGLLNTAAAALLIADDANGGRRLRTATLSDGGTDTYRFNHDGSGELKLTLVWTDPAGTPPPWSLNPTTPMLVNDLDLLVVRESDGQEFRPWLLDPANPGQAATTGANHRDNVEIVDASGAGAGTYLVTVSHTGSLTGDQQYALVQSGLQPLSATAVDVAAAPRRLSAAPNPFNPLTEISFALPREEDVRLAVFDARGRRLVTLAAGRLPAGEHRLAWDGRDQAGRTLAAGVYLARLQAGDRSETLRLTLVK